MSNVMNPSTTSAYADKMRTRWNGRLVNFFSPKFSAQALYIFGGISVVFGVLGLLTNFSLPGLINTIFGATFVYVGHTSLQLQAEDRKDQRISDIAAITALAFGIWYLAYFAFNIVFNFGFISDKSTAFIAAIIAGVMTFVTIALSGAWLMRLSYEAEANA